MKLEYPATRYKVETRRTNSTNPPFSDQVELSLKKVENRRNPNSTQSRDLNSALSSLPTVLHLLTSRPLSQHALSVINMEQLCDRLKMVRLTVLLDQCCYHRYISCFFITFGLAESATFYLFKTTG